MQPSIPHLRNLCPTSRLQIRKRCHCRFFPAVLGLKEHLFVSRPTGLSDPGHSPLQRPTQGRCAIDRRQRQAILPAALHSSYRHCDKICSHVQPPHNLPPKPWNMKQQQTILSVPVLLVSADYFSWFPPLALVLQSPTGDLAYRSAHDVRLDTSGILSTS